MNGLGWELRHGAAVLPMLPMLSRTLGTRGVRVGPERKLIGRAARIAAWNVRVMSHVGWMGRVILMKMGWDSRDGGYRLPAARGLPINIRCAVAPAALLLKMS